MPVADWDPLPSLGPSEPKPTRPQCDIIQAGLLSSPCLVRCTGISLFLHFTHTARAKKSHRWDSSTTNLSPWHCLHILKVSSGGTAWRWGSYMGQRWQGLVWPNELPLYTARALYYRPGHCWTKGKESVWTHGQSFFWKYSTKVLHHVTSYDH